MGLESILFVAAAAISTIVAIFKNARKGNILKAVIEGVEEAASRVPDSALKSVKNRIAEKSEELGVSGPLHKIVQVLTKKSD
ncbi:MAG: hypothetical protein V3W26_05475 [Thermodesulfobacteriota bacterium]